MNFIKRVFNKEVNREVHLQFQKFSRGEFRDRALIIAKKTGNKYTINTSAEFANELVAEMAERLGHNSAKITGAIVSTLNLEIDYKEKKQFQGVKRFLIEKEMTGEQVIELIENYPKAFFALSFEAEGSILKIKPKAPKSGKPSSKGEDAPKVDFCKLITNDKSIAEDFVWEKADFKQAEIKHTFIIEEIIIPEELKKEKDFALVREKALKKGKIIREAKIDGQNIRKEVEFEA